MSIQRKLKFLAKLHRGCKKQLGNDWVNYPKVHTRLKEIHRVDIEMRQTKLA